MSDHLDAALAAALTDRPWILAPTLPRNDRQTFELGFRAGWDARGISGQDILVTTRTMLAGLVDRDPRALLTARAFLKSEDDE